MRTGVAAGHPGFYHEAAFYDSDDEFVDVVRPFLLDGVEASEAVVVACRDDNTALLRRALGDTDRVAFLPGAGQYDRPAATIRAFLGLFADCVAAGAEQIRVVGDVPHPGLGADWHAWARYEAAANVAFDGYPVWGLCPYDTRITPDWVLDDVAATHPHLAHGGDHHSTNDRFCDPLDFLRSLSPRLDTTAPPVAVLESPSCSDARAAVAAACAAHGLARPDADDLVLAVSEVIANAQMHGRPPVRATVHAGPEGVSVMVTDAGPGPGDPLAGLLGPGEGSVGGRGLWIVHQLRVAVSMGATPDGFTVCLRVPT